MPKQRNPKSDFEKKHQKETEIHEPMFWLIPESIRIIKPHDFSMRIELLELELDMRRVEHLSNGEAGRWFKDGLYKIARYAWLYTWVSLVNILGVVMLVAANVLWFWFLGWLLYIMFIK